MHYGDGGGSRGYEVRVVRTLGGCPVLVLGGIVYVADTGDDDINDMIVKDAIMRTASKKAQEPT